MKRKQTDPKKAVKRLKIIMASIAVMLLVILVAKINMSDEQKTYKGEVETVMDAQLDSLIAINYPEGTRIIEKGFPEYLDDEIIGEETLRQAITRYEVAETEAEQDSTKIKELRTDAERARMKLQRKHDKSYYRNAKIELPDGTKYSLYQRTDSGLEDSYLFFRTTITEETQKEMKELEQ